jgi:RNA polymerase sigma-70 factor (ECF subfamily)
MQDADAEEPGCLLRRWATDRDRDALERALVLALPRAWNQARRTLGPGADADDATQEALLQLTRTAHRYDGSVPFGAWLGRLVQVAAAQVRRAEGRHRHRERVAASMMETTSAAKDPVDHEAVRAALAELPGKARAAIEMHYFADLPQAEAAAALGISENALAVRVHRAREALRARLLARGIGTAAVAMVASLGTANAAEVPAALAAVPARLTLQAVTGALPATSVPLSLLQKGWLFMAAHPLTAALIIATLASAPLLVVASAEPAPPGDAWRGPAAKLLPLIEPSASLQSGLDADALRRLGVGLKPTSLLVDPQAAPVIAHIRRQVSLLVEQNAMPDLLRSWDGGHGLVMTLGGTAAGMAAGDRPRAMLVADVGNADDAKAWVVEALDGDPRRLATHPMEIAGFTGAGTDSDFWRGYSGGTVAICASPQQARSALAGGRRPDPTWMRSPAWMTVDGGGMLSRLAAIDAGNQDPYGLGAWLPDWRTRAPRLAARLAAVDGTWGSTGEVVDGPRFLRPISGTLPDLAAADDLLNLTCGIDTALLGAWLRTLGQDDVRHVLPLLATLSGDLTVRVRTGVPLPVVEAVAGVADQAAARAAMIALLFPLKPVETTVPGGHSWSTITPAGSLGIIIADGRLVLSTDPQGPASVKLHPRSQALPAGTALTVRADLPTLARQWLPLVWNSLASRNETIMTNYRQIMSYLCLSGGSWVHDGQHPSLAACAKALKSYFPEERASLRRSLAAMLQIDGADEGFTERAAAAIMARFAVFRATVGDNRRHVLVFRTTEGFGLMQDDDIRVLVFRTTEGFEDDDMARYDRPIPILTLAEATQRLHGLRHLSGPRVDQLPVIPWLEQPMFDRRWLPDVQVVARHLAPWRLDARVDGRTVRYTESGLPVAGVMLSTLGFAVAASESQIEGKYYRRLDDLDGPAVAARHARALAIVRRLAAVDEVFWDRIEIARPGDFVRHGLLSLDEAALLNGGAAVADAAAVDRIGLWQSHTMQTWRIPLEGRWVLMWSKGMHAVMVTCTSPTMYPYLSHVVQPVSPSPPRQEGDEPAGKMPAPPSDF